MGQSTRGPSNSLQSSHTPLRFRKVRSLPAELRWAEPHNRRMVTISWHPGKRETNMQMSDMRGDAERIPQHRGSVTVSLPVGRIGFRRVSILLRDTSTTPCNWSVTGTDSPENSGKPGQAATDTLDAVPRFRTFRMPKSGKSQRCAPQECQSVLWKSRISRG